MEEKKDRHQSLIRPFTLISTRENGIDEVRRLLEIVYNLFLELWMPGVYFFDFFLVSVATVSVLSISRGKMISNPKENSSDFWRAGIFVF